MSPNERYEISGGNAIITSGLTQAENQHGERFIRFFLEMIPARKKELSDTYQSYVETHPTALFLDFIEDAVRTNGSDKVLFPRECQLDTQERRHRRKIIKVAAFQGKSVSIDERLKIYFGEGDPYMAMREIVCSHCPNTMCIHCLSSPS